jgi:hypothetical protein
MHRVKAVFVCRFEAPKSCTQVFPPQKQWPVDKSSFPPLCDSDSMTVSSHQAGTLRCKATPETGKRSGTEGMPDHQISRQTSRKAGKCSRGGGYKDNDYQVRHHASDATPDRDTHSTKANQQGLRAELGNRTSESGKNGPWAKDFQLQTQWPLVAIPAAIFV